MKLVFSQEQQNKVHERLKELQFKRCYKEMIFCSFNFKVENINE